MPAATVPCPPLAVATGCTSHRISGETVTLNFGVCTAGARLRRVSRKSELIARRIEPFLGQRLPAHYLAYFDCFNRQLFYEAHDVLEHLWLEGRHSADGNFYKGLIQLAGAFVHVQKNRPGPAVALLGLARINFGKYPTVHHSLDSPAVLALIEEWCRRLDGAQTTTGLFEKVKPPRLILLDDKSPEADP